MHSHNIGAENTILSMYDFEFLLEVGGMGGLAGRCGSRFAVALRWPCHGDGKPLETQMTRKTQGTQEKEARGGRSEKVHAAVAEDAAC